MQVFGTTISLIPPALPVDQVLHSYSDGIHWFDHIKYFILIKNDMSCKLLKNQINFGFFYISFPDFFYVFDV